MKSTNASTSCADKLKLKIDDNKDSPASVSDKNCLKSDAYVMPNDCVPVDIKPPDDFKKPCDHEQVWQNVPKGRSHKRKRSRSRSQNKRFNDTNARNQTAQNKKPVSKDDYVLPNFVRSKSSQESTTSSSSNSRFNSNIPIWSKDKRFKSHYKWVPKGSVQKSSDISPMNSYGRISSDHGEKGKITQKETVSNGVLKFANVNFVPELKHSLLSVSQICNEGFSTHFTKKECLILKPGVVIPEEWTLVGSELQNNAYIIDINHNTPENITCLFSKASEQNAMLWHRRLGHANAKNLNRLANNDLVQGLPIKDFITFQKCVACAQRKHCWKPHKPKMINSIDSLLRLLDMDLFGLDNVLNINRSSYCLVIIYDYSHFTWVFFLKNKSEIAELVMKFITLIENQTNLKTKVIRSENGTEFKNVVLNKFCAYKGVQRQYSAARTPQQNGVVERCNRTVIDDARNMRFTTTSDLLG
ncbi:hypothetical protein L1887_24128 [Cichorium endivia]|nr:hypothetical protein L1887_24128 [Cichorium endivia]